MRKYKFTSISMHLILFVAITLSSAQKNITTPFIEKMTLFSDRSIYISGEQVLFSAFLASENHSSVDLSQIAYVDIVSPDGKIVTGNKFQIETHLASGCVTIPVETITGIYYIRAYTKYMRNMGPESFPYVAIKIINPLRNDVLEGHDKSEIPNHTLQPASSSNEKYSISTDKEEYLPRENVIVNVNANKYPESQKVPLSGGRGYKGYSGLFISVVPESTSSSFIPSFSTVDRLPDSIKYYPETRGVSVTGVLKDGTNGQGISNARVNLSIIGHGRDFMATQTDSSGRFFFSLPAYTGSRDLFLCAEKEDVALPHLFIDNDFSSPSTAIPFPPFKLSEDERKAAYALALNARINAYYENDTIVCTNKYENSDKAFYGQPNEILRFEEYVQLPSLEEYFSELSPAVNIKKRHGRKYFKVIGTRPEMAYNDPLVLVDWVVVNNPEKILSAPPTSLDRVEIINVPYVKGNITYGGIVSIISKKGDFAGIDLPSSGIFLRYQNLADTCHCHIKNIESQHVPDMRNTVFWNPDFQIKPDGNSHFAFKTPDTPGRYTIVLKGTDYNGVPFIQTKSFLVKEKG